MKRSRLEYPGVCARCGKHWGEHLTDIEAKRVGGCPFVAKEGEIEKPKRITEELYDEN